MKKIFFLLCTALLLISCNNTKDFKTFENNQWLSSQPQNFEITIDDDSKVFYPSFEFSYVYGSNFPEFPVQITITSPSGKTEKHTISFNVTNSNYVSNCTGDVCDLSASFAPKRESEKGVYKISISQSYKGVYLPNVIGVGVEFIEIY